MRETVIGIHYEKEPRLPNFAFPLTFDIDRVGEIWTATCMELGTSTFGDSLDEVRTELHEAVKLQLDEMESLGFIEDYLQESNVRVIRFPEPPASNASQFAIASV